MSLIKADSAFTVIQYFNGVPSGDWGGGVGKSTSLPLYPLLHAQPYNSDTTPTGDPGL